MKVLISILLSFHLATSAFASFSDRASEHLIKLKEMRSENIATIGVDDLNKINNYVINLTSILEEKSKKNSGILPFELNLIGESLKTLAFIHQKVLEKTSELNSLESLQLASIQIESFGVITDLFFGKKELRALSLDQIQMNREFKNLSEKIYSKQRLLKIEKEITLLIEKEESTSVDGLRVVELVKSGMGLALLSPNTRSDLSFGEKLASVPGGVGSGISRGFGAVAGPIQWRSHGRLHQNAKLLKRAQSELRPFDIVFERKSYKLTDYTIPGHWGHAGVYLGTKEQLLELGLWNTAGLIAYQDRIEKGQVIFQVRREGLVFNTLQEFIDLDEMAVVRLREMKNKSSTELEQILELLMSQNGKAYDYSFDVMTQSKVTCTEIIAFSYGTINWPTTPVMGRKSFTPNNVVELLYYQNSPLEFIFYITGYGSGYNDLKDEDFAKTVGFVRHEGAFKLHSITYDREFRRLNRGPIRIHTKKVDHYQVMNYLE